MSIRKRTIALFLLIAGIAIPGILSSQVIHRIYFDRFTHYEGDDWISYAPGTTITSVTIGDDYVYFGTAQGGVLRYHLYENFWDYPFTTSNGLSSNRILSLVFNPDDRRLYARTAKGLNVYERVFGYWMPAEESQITNRRKPLQIELENMENRSDYRLPSYYRPSIYQIPDFFTDNQYLYRNNGEILDQYNRVFNITTGMVDPWFRLWLGTNGLGVGMGDLDNISLKIFRRSLPNINTRDLLFDGRYTWFGGKGQQLPPAGIARWDIEEDTWTYFEAGLNYDIYNDDVRVIEKAGKLVFFGTDLGLITYDSSRERWRSYTIAHGLESNRIYDLYAQGKRMYIGTDEGLNWYDTDTEKISESGDTGIDNIPVYNIVKWQENTLLLATRNGVVQYDISTDRFSLFPVRSAILDLRVSAISANKDSLWIAGEFGISRFDKKTDSWQSFTQVLSQLNTRVNDIDFTKGNVWFATDDGLLKYDVNRDYWYLYTEEDGLIDDRTFHIDVDGDDLWISTSRGVTIFRWYNPDRLE